MTSVRSHIILIVRLSLLLTASTGAMSAPCGAKTCRINHTCGSNPPWTCVPMCGVPGTKTCRVECVCRSTDKCDPKATDCKGACKHCFPASALVQLEHGGYKKLSEAVIGDTVLVAAADGSLSYEPIFAFSHRSPQWVMRTGVLHTVTGRSLEASLGHYVLVGPAKKLVAMRDVQVGDVVWVAGNGTVLVPDVVREMSVQFAEGAYAPHTASGTVVIGGVTASCFTEHISPWLARSLLRPVQALSSVLGEAIAQRVNDVILFAMYGDAAPTSLSPSVPFSLSKLSSLS